MEQQRFKGQIVVLTGSSDGIGYDTALRFGSEGATVIISSRNKNKVDKAVNKLKGQGIDAYGQVFHVGKPKQRKTFVDFVKNKFGRIDILYLNAGCGFYAGNFIEMDEKAYDKMFDINVKSYYFLIQSCFELMTKSKRASIIIMSSISAYNHDQRLGAYSLTKLALCSLVKCLAKELYMDHNIRVNGVAPTIIKTSFSQCAWNDREDLCKKHISVKRLGTPQDVSGVVLFLASQDSDYINGEIIKITGYPFPSL